eukprot:3209638-Pleurochrysis_carterae.AAC.1
MVASFFQKIPPTMRWAAGASIGSNSTHSAPASTAKRSAASTASGNESHASASAAANFDSSQKYMSSPSRSGRTDKPSAAQSRSSSSAEMAAS